jgi:hypothetical protein
VPNDVNNLQPMVPEFLRSKGLWQRRLTKSEPLPVGAAWVAVFQAGGAILKATGHGVDLTLWQLVSFGAGAVGFLVSRSHVLVLGLRLLGLRAYCLCGLTDRANYDRMRKAVEKAFMDRVAAPETTGRIPAAENVDP